MPAVSVIIPVYNVEPYIARCARSLFGQTLKDLEYIFIDDCSPDKSMAILQDILEEFPGRKEQVKCIRMPHNSGVSAVRMHGIALATGDYVIHCDSDDELAPEACQTLYDKAVSGDYDIVLCDFRQIRDKQCTVKSLYAPPGEELKAILTGKVMGSVWCRLIRLSLLRDIEAPVGNMIEDVVIAVQATCRARRIGYVPEPLYNYFLRPSSLSMADGKRADLYRWEQVYANARQIEDLLVNRYGMDKEDPALVYFKYYSRHYLRRHVQDADCYRKWRNTFPEIDRSFLRTPGIPVREKWWFVLIHLRLYYPWKRITSLFRKG